MKKTRDTLELLYTSSGLSPAEFIGMLEAFKVELLLSMYEKDED